MSPTESRTKTLVCSRSAHLGLEMSDKVGLISWSTTAFAHRQWKVTLDIPDRFLADLMIPILPEDGNPIKKTSIGMITNQSVLLPKELMKAKAHLEIEII